MALRTLAPALAVLLVVAGAAAQETPRRLLPRAAPSGEPPPPEAAAPSPTPAPAIRRERLGAPSLSTVGLGNPVFGADGPLWSGADPGRMLALFDRLPERLALPALRELARRLLVAPGPA
ncbi:MAG TPA: hypothetical protein ENJ38_12060, partial [Rhodospirillales bacterium]|nr:hypothetical protein [Rhodospirillales bacterium]